MTAWICTTCCVQYPETATPPERCAICEDERQYVGAEGQRWTSMEAIARNHHNDWRALAPGLAGIGVTPAVGIGQRSLFIMRPEGGVLWDMVPLITDETVGRIRAAGGVAAIAISHPHFYAAMVTWSERLGDVPIYLHEADRAHVMRPSANIRFWSGETLALMDGVTLIRCGGHFEGSTVLHWAAGEGALFTGDTIQLVPDKGWVSFMRSYPNLIPLPAARVRTIAGKVMPFAFEKLYGGWWDRVMTEDGQGAVQRSAERYIRALE
ncbi:MAG TPA: hypothetical protein VGM83_02740 [Devosiaceae bacterium]|jgi:hypothetical protein